MIESFGLWYTPAVFVLAIGSYIVTRDIELALTLLAPESTAGPRVTFLHAPLLAATLTVLAAVFLVGDLLAGIAARVADPRLRAATEQAEDSAYA